MMISAPLLVAVSLRSASHCGKVTIHSMPFLLNKHRVSSIELDISGQATEGVQVWHPERLEFRAVLDGK